MKTLMLIALMAASLLTGCTEEAYLSVPHAKAVKPKLDTPVKCGRVHYRKDRYGHVVLDPKDADCLKRQMQACAHDRRVLVVANRANVRTIEAINAHAAKQEPGLQSRR